MNLTECCLISKEPIEHKITLNQCNHSFEYYYLYQEIIQQKKRHIEYFKCPYCRMAYHGTIPYYEMDDIEKINPVNYHHKTLLPIYKCEKCDDNAHFYKSGKYCIRHYPSSIKTRCTSLCKNGNKCCNYAVLGDKCNKHSEKTTVDNKHSDNKHIDNNT
jgi:hypothetical protein